MKLADMIAELPGDTRVSVLVGVGPMTAEDLRRAFIATQAKRLLTTAEAADLFGYSQSQWAKWAAAGEIDGAFQDADGGPWRLPYPSCEAHVDARAASNQNGGRRGRPWGRSEGVQGEGLTVVEGGSTPLGRVPRGAAESEGLRLAGEGPADGLRGAR